MEYTGIPNDMDSEVEEAPIAAPAKSPHLVCGRAWALLIAVASVYFAYRTYREIADDALIGHNWWNALTWIVWAAFAAGLCSETRCRRERLLFALLCLQFLMALVLSVWSSASPNQVRNLQWSSFAVWCVAALFSLVLLIMGRKTQSSGPRQ